MYQSAGSPTPATRLPALALQQFPSPLCGPQYPVATGIRPLTAIMKYRSFVVAAFSAALVFLVGCGRNDSSSGDQAKSSGTPATAARDAQGNPPPASGREIEITGNDTMKFSVTEIRSKPGEALTVTLRNVGTMPKFSMGHNWVLLKKDADVEKFVGEAANAPTTDYIPMSLESDMIAHTKLLGPKESDSVTFNTPPEPGRYVFLCSFPGHYQVGMRGELIVE